MNTHDIRDDLLGTVTTSSHLESEHESTMITKSAAQRYHDEVSTFGKGHILGAPHNHVYRHAETSVLS